MTTLAKIAGLALVAAVLTTSFAQAGISAMPGKLQIRPVAGCSLASGEFPNDIWVTNKGAAILKAGAKVQWNVPFANASGVYTLVADLGVGKSVFLSNVIPGSVEAGHDCKASVTL